MVQLFLLSTFEPSASLSDCAHSSQHTSTVLAPSFTLMGLASSSQSQAAQVFTVMIGLLKSPTTGRRPKKHFRIAAAVKIFSDLREPSAQMGRALELRRRAAIGFAEGGAEM